MKPSRSLVLVLLSTVIACSSNKLEPEPQPAQEKYALVSNAARIAFDQGRYEQAVELYRQALDLAYVSDDVQAIVDAPVQCCCFSCQT